MNDDQNDLQRRLEALANQARSAKLPGPAGVRRASERRRRHRRLTLASAVAAVTMVGVAFGVAALATPSPQRVDVATRHVHSTTTTLPSTTTPAPPTTVASVDRAIEVFGDCQTPSLEPASIILTCADAGVVVQDLSWRSWTATSAVAVGTLVYNDCTPSCAEGHFHDVPGTTITLTVPVKDPSGQLVWSEIQEDPEPPGYATGPYHGGPQPLQTYPSTPTTSTTTPSTVPSTSTTTVPQTTTTVPQTTTTVGSVDRAIEVFGDCLTPSLEPASIVLTCADAGVVVQDLSWRSWTATSAVAVGTLVYNDCTPSCAEGHFHDVPGTTITLTVPVKDPSGQLVWSEIQEDPEPPGYATGPYHGGPQPLQTRPG